MNILVSILSVAIMTAALSPLVAAQALHLEYSTYLGGSCLAYGRSISTNAQGETFVTGWTGSDDFPLENPYQASQYGADDIFVSCFSSSGSAMVYSTYIGGSKFEEGFGICVDSLNQAYVIGITDSYDFPTVNPYQASAALFNDIAIVHLSSSGSALIYSTYLGGNTDDFGYGIAIDSNGRVFTAGYTNSTDFPIVNPYQVSYAGGSKDVIVSCLSSTGSALFYSTYLGGYTVEYAYGIAADSLGKCYVTGTTLSSDYPIMNPYQISKSSQNDSFVSCLGSSGSTLHYSTFLGGSSYDYGFGVVLDSQNQAHVIGETRSTDFPVKYPYQATFGSGTYDIVSYCIASSGSSLIYSTYLGGSDRDHGGSLTLDSIGMIYISGYTESEDFPTKYPFQSSYAGGEDSDIVVCCFSPSGSSLMYSTYLGGSGNDDQNDGYSAISLDCFNRVYITGSTRSRDFPTENPFQASNNDSTFYNAFVTKISLHAAPTLPPPTPTPAAVCSLIDSGDYNGDGTSDIAVFRGSSGMWSARNLTRVYFGNSADALVPADYNGDGTTDIAIFRANGGMWSVRSLSRFYLGGTADQPVSGDYNGNGTAEAGIFRPSSGLWSIRDLTRIYLGAAGDTVIPGYYDADDTKDVAIFRGSAGMWSVRNLTRFYFGASTDDLVPGDYNEAGRWEGGVYRSSTGMWSIRNVTRFYLGNSTDSAIPGDYNGDGADDAAIFRDSAGLWSVRNLTRVYFGSTGDIPVTR